MKRLLAGILTTFCLALPAAADETASSRDELFEQFDWNPEATEIKVQNVADGLYVLFGLGGNIGVSIGESGTLIVDDQLPELMPKIEAAIATIGGKHIDFAINTHWHFDHADGNLALGPTGTWLVSQANSRDMMTAPHIINLTVARYNQESYPSNARPVITFDDQMSFHFNGERIDLIHSGPAHTTGDAAVIFRNHNAVHMGDVFNNTGYPFIDADSGGEIDGMIDFCEAVLTELKPGAIVIPGHGEVTDDDTLRRYVEMLKTVRGRISKMIDEGMSIEEVIDAKPTADLDEVFGDVEKSMGFVDRVFTSLKKKR
jgi:glyoxylase-like metal-dependent hydrolase (beta-lactamase superfamily II)